MKFTDIPTPLTNHYMHKPSGTVFKGRTLFQHAQHLERQLTREHEFGEDMAKQVVAVEDALGFKSDDIPESDKHRLVMERIRDLIAAEGELGDLREGVAGLMKILTSDLATDMGLAHPLVKAALNGFQSIYLKPTPNTDTP